MVNWKRAWISGSAVVVVGLGLIGVVMAQQEPKSDKSSVPSVVKGESDRGVSAAIKDAVDKIPAPTGPDTKYFRVMSITGQKTAKGETIMVDVEVQDKPFASAAEKSAK